MQAFDTRSWIMLFLGAVLPVAVVVVAALTL